MDWWKPMPQSKKVLGLNPSQMEGPFMCSLHVFFVSLWVFCGYSSFFPHCKHTVLSSPFKLPRSSLFTLNGIQQQLSFAADLRCHRRLWTTAWLLNGSLPHPPTPSFRTEDASRLRDERTSDPDVIEIVGLRSAGHMGISTKIPTTCMLRSTRRNWCLVSVYGWMVCVSWNELLTHASPPLLVLVRADACKLTS